MTRYVLAMVLIIAGAVSAFPQQEPDEAEILRQLGMGGTFALGNLALRDLQRGNDPVLQLKRFFAEAKMPLSRTQERQLSEIIDAQVKALQDSGKPDEEAVRRANQEFTKKSNDIFTQEQRAELRRYRTEQIMTGGGFPALRLVLENAQAPLTADQERQIQGLYDDFNQHLNQISRESKNAPDRAQLDKLEAEALAKVIRGLTPAQRRALAASGRGPLTRR